MKLYRVTVALTALVVGEDESDARMEASTALDSELTAMDVYDEVEVEEVAGEDQLRGYEADQRVTYRVPNPEEPEFDVEKEMTAKAFIEMLQSESPEQPGV